MAITLTTVLPADYSELTDVWEASVRATHDFLSEADIQTFRPLILNEFLAMVDLTAARNEAGKILGFVGVAEQKVEMLFLHPEARGKGLGKQLLRHAITHKQATTVDVNEQNPQALAFYEHLGFVRIGRSEVDGMGKPYPLLHLALVTDRISHESPRKS